MLRQQKRRRNGRIVTSRDRISKFWGTTSSQTFHFLPADDPCTSSPARQEKEALLGPWCQDEATRYAWFSGGGTGSGPSHFKPLHPHCQLCYLAAGLPDILYTLRLPGQRSHQGIRPGTRGPTQHNAGQAGGYAELPSHKSLGPD